MNSFHWRREEDKEDNEIFLVSFLNDNHVYIKATCVLMHVNYLSETCQKLGIRIAMQWWKNICILGLTNKS